MGKKIILPLLFAGMILSACSSAQRDYTLTITGDRDIPFTAALMRETGRGRAQSQIFSAHTPQSFKITATELSCRARKLDAPGTLRIEISADGMPQRTAETSEPQGSVGISAGGRAQSGAK